MSVPNTTNWIRIGLLALPVYGLLTGWATLDFQPDQVKETEEWARFVGSTSYLVDHVFGTIGGGILAILGVFALGAYLARSRAGRLGLAAMVVTVVGQALGLSIGGITAFATNAIGRAYLAGIEDVMGVEFSASMTATLVLVVLLLFVGNVLLGVAVWRSGILPKWAGALWAFAPVLMYIFGLVYAMTIGANATPPTVPAGAVLLAISGAWIAWSALSRPSSVQAVGAAAAQPRVQ